MITKKMARWLQNNKAKDKKRNLPKHCTYMHRIQKKIDKELDMLLWLAQNYPNVFLGKFETINAYGHSTHKRDKSNSRLKKLLLTVKALNPNCNVELVLQNIKLEDEKNG